MVITNNLDEAGLGRVTLDEIYCILKKLNTTTFD
jgi:hypothetical protein